jgi:hypothetical protein
MSILRDIITLFNRHHKQEYLSLYNINPETGAYIIEVSLDDYSEIFNGWDASPVRKKEIEPELMDYFEQAAIEIPIKEKIEICFYIPAELKDPDKEIKSISAILNNFRVKYLFTEKMLHDIYRRYITYVIISAMLLTIAYTFTEFVEISLFYKIMIHGMFILGWWILWEGSSMLFFTGHDVRVRKKYFERYLKSQIYFKEIKFSS